MLSLRGGGTLARLVKVVAVVLVVIAVISLVAPGYMGINGVLRRTDTVTSLQPPDPCPPPQVIETTLPPSLSECREFLVNRYQLTPETFGEFLEYRLKKEQPQQQQPSSTSSPPPSPPPPPPPPAEKSPAPVVPQHQIVLKVLGYRRLASLKRLLESLLEADYSLGYPSRVDVYLDFPRTAGDIVKMKGEFGANRRAVEEFAKQWQPRSPVNIHVRAQNAGLVNQWLESWWPWSDNEYALVLEDDLEVSPYYFKWLLRALDKYRGTPEARKKYSHMTAITLQKAEVNAINHWAGWQTGKDMTTHYAYQQPGSWGLLFFPERWRDFREFRESSQDKECCAAFKIPGSSNQNGATKTNPDAWTEFYNKFIWLNGYYVLTPGVPRGRTLCLNHLEPGVHYSDKMQPWQRILEQEYEGLYTFPDLQDMMAFNGWGKQVNNPETDLVKPEKPQ